MIMLLETKGLTKSFGNLVVTNAVDLTVGRGERHAIIGPNGAGKTSFLHQLGGQLAPDSGAIFLSGEDVTRLPPDRRCHRGLARTYQKNNLFPNLTAFENIRLAVQGRMGRVGEWLKPVVSLSQARDRTLALMQQVRLERAPETLLKHLSYGEQRQVEIAVALAGEPDILLLDEPTAGMSPAETDRMIEMISGLDPALSVLLVEHDMTVVFSLAHRITVLHHGEVLASGTPKEISDDPQVQSVYLGVEI